jgi:hypothetical protein
MNGNLFTNTEFHTRVAKLKNLTTLELDELVKEYEDLLSASTTLNKVNTELRNKLDEVEARHNKLKDDYSKTLEVYENMTKLAENATNVNTEIVPTTVVVFDPAIHTVKPPRPITRVERDQILYAYEKVYKVVDNCKTLPEFFSYVQLNICSHASRTEIEGVIYNRFDLRLYK